MIKKFFILFFSISFLFSSYLLAFDNLVIHPAFSKASIDIYNQKSQNKISQKQANAIIFGSIAEDTDPRYLNHFYNPSTGLGLRSGVLRGLSAKEWAQKQNSASGDYSESAILNNYRNGNYQRAYQGIGHILHLIQDMAVPAHTRNDAHATGDPFEEWAKRYGKIELNKIENVYVHNLDQAFDELASFSHYNFFSKDTLFFNKDYQIIEESFQGIKRKYAIDDINGIKTRMFVVEEKSLSSSYFIDDYRVHQDYWKMLHPKAVSYGVGVLDYFMREFEKIDQEENKKSFWGKLKNRLGSIDDSLKYNWGDFFISARLAAHDIGEVFQNIFGKDYESEQIVDDFFTEYIPGDDEEQKDLNPTDEKENDENKKEENDDDSDVKQEAPENLIKIIRVIDGDTIELSTGEKIRYLGINAPELGEPGPEDDECLAWVARLRNLSLLNNGPISLIKDPLVDKDEQGNLLRYVYSGSVFVNRVMAEEGLAENFFCEGNKAGCHSAGDQVRKPQIIIASQNAENFNRGLFSGVCADLKDQAVLGEKIIFENNEQEDSFLDERDNNEVWEDEEDENKNESEDDFLFEFEYYYDNEEGGFSASIEPETKIISQAPRFSASSSALFIFKSNFLNAFFEYQLNEEDWKTASSSAYFEGLDDGFYQLKARAIFGQTKDRTPAKYSWTIDTSLPEAKINSIEHFAEENQLAIIWQGQNLNEMENEFLKYDIRYATGSEAWHDWLGATASTSVIFSLEFFSGQDICFQVRAFDRAGNIGEWSDAVCFYGGEKPIIKNFFIYNELTGNASSTASLNVKLNYEIENAHLIKDYLISSSSSIPTLDDVAWSDKAYYDFVLDEGDGEKQVYFFIKNNKDEIILSVSSSIILDTSPPIPPEITNITPEPKHSSTIKNIYWINKNLFVLEGSKEKDVSEIIINGASYAANIGDETWSVEYDFGFDIDKELVLGNKNKKRSINLCALMVPTPETKIFSFQAKDAVGNFSEVVLKTFAIDLKSPTLKSVTIYKSIPMSKFFLFFDDSYWAIGSGIKEHIFEIKDESGSWVSLEVQGVDKFESIYGSKIEIQGEFISRAKVMNWAGNYSEWYDKAIVSHNYYPVISEIYGGGGNSGSYWKNDFIELYNPTPLDISLDGWSVQYAAATSDNWNVAELSGEIKAGGYYLIKAGGSSGGEADISDWDATASFNMSAASGKVALSKSVAKMLGLSDSGVVDFVGYGSANEFEGLSSADGLSNTKSLERIASFDADSDSMELGGEHEFIGNGWDTNRNDEDFVLRNMPQPQSSQSALEIFSY